MKFKVLNAYKDESNKIFITGCYVPINDNEKKLLSYLKIVLNEVNVDDGGNVICDRFVSNDRTILFKSVPIETIYSILLLHNNSFNLDLHIALGRNMQNNPLKTKVSKYFSEHPIRKE